MNDKKTELLRSTAEAIIDGDTEARDSYIQRIKKFNKANPAFAIRSPGTAVRKRVKSIVRERATFKRHDGMKANRQGAALNERYDFGNF